MSQLEQSLPSSQGTQAGDLIDLPSTRYGTSTRTRVLSVIEGFKSENISFPDFMNAVFGGDLTVTGDSEIKAFRTSLTKDKRFTDILSSMLETRPGKRLLKELAMNLITEDIDKELSAFGQTQYMLPNTLDLDQISLIAIDSINTKAKETAPTLHGLLSDVSRTAQ